MPLETKSPTLPTQGSPMFHCKLPRVHSITILQQSPSNYNSNPRIPRPETKTTTQAPTSSIPGPRMRVHSICTKAAPPRIPLCILVVHISQLQETLLFLQCLLDAKPQRQIFVHSPSASPKSAMQEGQRMRLPPRG